ncbi:hypothetical protein M3O75_08330 [Klebsiella pneumoniae]|nr:hypothetical protein [Klebsiella pneumoniae]
MRQTIWIVRLIHSSVWDIARKMKIIFPRDKDDAVIDSKCRQLFSGEKTLDELGGAYQYEMMLFQMAIYYQRKNFLVNH